MADVSEQAVEQRVKEVCDDLIQGRVGSSQVEQVEKAISVNKRDRSFGRAVADKPYPYR